MEHGFRAPRAGPAAGRALRRRRGTTALAVSDSYFRAESRCDLEAVVDHFAENAVIVHPDGSRSEGREAIRAFYAGVFDALASIDVRRVGAVGGGVEAAVEWRALVVGADGAERSLRGVNLVTVADGRFTRIYAYFGEAARDWRG